MAAEETKANERHAEITALRARLEELTRSEARLEAEISRAVRVLERLPLDIYIFNKDNRLVFENRPMATLLGYSVEEAERIGPIFPTLLHPDDLATAVVEHEERLAKAKDGEVVEILCRMRHASGEYRFYQSRHTVYARAEDGSPAQILGTVVDMTSRLELEMELERMAAEKQRKADELHLFKTLVAKAQDGISLSTKEGVFLYGNPAFEEMTGLGARLKGSSARDIVHPDASPSLAVEAHGGIETEGHWQGLVRHMRPDGREWMAQLSLVLLQGSGEGGAYVASIARDVTSQLRADEERAALQARVIEAQQVALSEVSTPLIPIADEVLAMPLVGVLDSARAKQMIEVLLEGIAERRAAVVILDITGIKVVDTYVARALVKAAQAARLLGAEVVLTGIGPQLAQTLAMLDVDLQGIIVRGSFQSGIAYALSGRRLR